MGDFGYEGIASPVQAAQEAGSDQVILSAQSVHLSAASFRT